MGKPQEITVDNLNRPEISLTFTPNPDGKTVRVDLNLPKSTGNDEEQPFLETTRSESQNLLNSARNAALGKLKNSGITVGPIDFDYESTSSAGISANGNLNKVVKGSFNIQTNDTFRVNGQINIEDGKIGEAIKAAKNQFESDRDHEYRERAERWSRSTEPRGQRIYGADGDTYFVTSQAAANYYNQTKAYPWDPNIAPATPRSKDLESGGFGKDNEKQSIAVPAGPNPDQKPENGSTAISRQGNDRNASQPETTLLETGHPLNRQYRQALETAENLGIKDAKETAALAVQTITQAPGYRSDQDISVVQGKNGPIVSQGEGASAINLPVPQAKQGDFERVSAQLSQQTPVQIANAPDATDRSRAQPQL
jgi:hypothetical protein